MTRKAFVWLALAYVLALAPAGFAQSGSLSPSELAERASNSNLKPNPDGSADIYFGRRAPTTAGANWIRTVPGRGYFIGFRLYSPTQAYFDKVWKPGDIEKLK